MYENERDGDRGDKDQAFALPPIQIQRVFVVTFARRYEPVDASAVTEAATQSGLVRSLRLPEDGSRGAIR